MKEVLYVVTVFGLLLFTTSCKDKQVKDVQEKEVASMAIDTVVIEGMQFNPSEVYINKGDKIVWINKGIVTHDVSQDPDKSWTSGNLEVGKTFEMSPEGDFDYFCSIHPTMKGKVHVK